MLVAAGRWGLSLLPFTGQRPPRYLFLLHYSNLGILLGQFVNTWGTAGVKAVALHVRFQYPVREITIAAIIELVASNLPNVFFAGGALLWFLVFTNDFDLLDNGRSLISILIIALAITCLIVVTYRGQFLKYAFKLPLLSRFRSSRIYEAIQEGFSKDFLRKLPMGKLASYSFFCVVINILKAIIIIRAFEIDVPTYAIILAVCGLHFLTIVSFTPGGLGIYEAGFTGILVGFGTPMETAIVVALVKRVLDDLSVVCFYLAILPYFRLKLRQGTFERVNPMS